MIEPTPREEKLMAEAYERAQVIVYLRKHPGALSREVAADVFGGTGAPRTSGRARAARLLNDMHGEGFVRREGDGTLPSPFRWFALEVE